jgi:uncharacterized membrane protein
MPEYDVGIKVHMPGNAKVSEYHITVQAQSLADGIAVAEDAWRKITTPRDMTIKENAPA